MMAGVAYVPLDLRMAPAVLRRIADRAETPWLAVGTGPGAPEPARDGLGHLRVVALDALTAEVEEGGQDFPPDWQDRLDAWTRPTRADLLEIVYTSGTTSEPKGVQLTHGTMLATLEVCRVILPPRHHRLVSILPLSHLFEQAIVLFYGTMLGCEVVYVRSLNPRVLLEAIRDLRATSMVVPPQFIDLFWGALRREVERTPLRRAFDPLRAIARRLPYPARRRLFGRLHRQLGGELRLIATAGAFLSPESQRSWEDLGIAIVQGYGATEAGPAAANTEDDHPTGVVGRTIAPVRIALAEGDNEILIGGPTVSPGYWRDPVATAEAFDADGWYHTGDIGRFDEHGRLVLAGRKKNVIVLPNGLNVFPEDIENVLAEHGLDQSVVLETSPGRIEAVVLPPGSGPLAVLRGGPGRSAESDAAAVSEIERIVRAANADLAVHHRIAAWRLWPEPDFPRTHSLKVRRMPVQAWVGADVPLALQEAGAGS
jgi:long-chain acyl-CoA synthetase